MTLAQRLKGTDRPVVVQFHAPWCGPCKALAPLVTRLEEEFQGRVDVVRVDVDAQPDFAKEVGVRGVPTLISFKDGVEIRRHTGGLDLDGLRVFFRSATGELKATEPVGKPAWHLAAKIGSALVLLLVAGRIPEVAWLRWVGFGMLFWAMRDLCLACQTVSRP